MILITDKYGVPRLDKDPPNEFLTPADMGQWEHLGKGENSFISYSLYMYKVAIDSLKKLDRSDYSFTEPNIYNFTWDTLLK